MYLPRHLCIDENSMRGHGGKKKCKAAQRFLRPLPLRRSPFLLGNVSGVKTLKPPSRNRKTEREGFGLGQGWICNLWPDWLQARKSARKTRSLINIMLLMCAGTTWVLKGLFPRHVPVSGGEWKIARTEKRRDVTKWFHCDIESKSSRRFAENRAENC